MPIIFRFNVPFSNRYLLITSRCSRHSIETRLIDKTKEWLNNQKISKHGLGRHSSDLDFTNSLLPLYLVEKMSEICPEVINAKIMNRDLF